MEDYKPDNLREKVDDALAIADESPESDSAPVPPEGEIAYDRELGASPVETVRKSDAERLRREVGEYSGEESAIERNAESARLEDGE
jgi:hypothetical protein